MDRSVSIDDTPVAAASMDGIGVIRDAQYAYANEPLARIHGYETSQGLIGYTWKELYTPVESLRAGDLLSRVHETGNWHGRVAAQKENGDSIPVVLSLQATEDGTVCVVRDITDRLEYEERLERYETILDTVDDGVYVLDEDLRVDMANERFFGMLAQFGFSREDVREMHAHDLVVNEDERAALEAEIESAIERESHIGSFEMSAELPNGDRVVCESRFRLYPEPDGDHRGCIGILRDITERKEQEQQLKRQRNELDTLNRINELLLAVARDLFESPMHGDIEQTVCTRLAESDLYQFAWIGKPEGGSDRLVLTASAGIDDEFIVSTTVTPEEAAAGQGPGRRAFQTGTIQTSQDIETDPTFEPWREAALDHEVCSAAAVPLTYDGTTYGILAVYAPRPLAFSRREQRGFEILGEAIGYAINATRTRRLLFAEEIVELELRLTDQSEFAVAAVDQLDSHLSLKGYVSTDDDSWLLYFSLSGADWDRFVDVAREETAVETARLIGDEGAESIVALTMQSSLLDSIAALGGKVLSGTIDGARGTFVVEIPQSTGVREFIEQIRSTYPGVELLAKRNHEQTAEQATWLSVDGHIDLTDRQRQALKAAYHAGYFEWPRENTAADIAELLDITRPTLQAHLRKAESKLIDHFFDGEANLAER